MSRRFIRRVVRHAVREWAFENPSSRQLSAADVQAIACYVASHVLHSGYNWLELVDIIKWNKRRMPE